MSTAVLNLNNMRDHLKDEQAGKRTVVVALGWERAKVYHGLCFVLGWVLGGYLPWRWNPVSGEEWGVSPSSMPSTSRTHGGCGAAKTRRRWILN